MLSPQDSATIDNILKQNNYTPPQAPASSSQPQDWYSQVINKSKEMAAQDGQEKGGLLNNAADFLGIKKAGQGLATATRVASGSINQTGQQETEAANAFHSLVSNHPVGSPERQAGLQKYLSIYEGGAKTAQPSNISTQSQVDPGTDLSNKEVLGSFGNVGLTALTPGISTPESLLGKTAVGAVTGYAFDKAQQANNNEKMTVTPGVGTAVGALLPFATKLTGIVGKSVLGVTTGAGKDVIQRAIDNPDAISAAIKSSTPETKQALVDTAKQSLQSFLQDRNSQFGEGLSKMVASEPINKQNILESFAKQVDKFGGQIKDGSLQFGDTALNASEQKSVQDVFDVVKSWKDVTPKGMDTLRQRIGNEIDNFKFANNGRDSAVLGGVKQALTNDMKSKIPGYGDLLRNYGSKTDAARSLSKELNLSGVAKPSTQLNQVMRLFKKDPAVLQNLTDIMGKEEANNFLNDVSGAILSNWFPQGGKLANAEKAFIEGGAALGAGVLHANPLGVAIAGTGAATASPRIVGKGATIIGKGIQKGVGKQLTKAATITASKTNQP